MGELYSTIHFRLVFAPGPTPFRSNHEASVATRGTFKHSLKLFRVKSSISNSATVTYSPLEHEPQGWERGIEMKFRPQAAAPRLNYYRPVISLKSSPHAPPSVENIAILLVSPKGEGCFLVFTFADAVSSDRAGTTGSA